jgi:hypothetical protein
MKLLFSCTLELETLMSELELFSYFWMLNAPPHSYCALLVTPNAAIDNAGTRFATHAALLVLLFLGFFLDCTHVSLGNLLEFVSDQLLGRYNEIAELDDFVIPF